MKNFHQKVAVITGAAGGIGQATAKKCVQLGIKVVLADNDLGTLENCQKTLEKMGGTLISVRTDVSQENDVQTLAETTLNHFGKVNLLFNHAGIPGPLGAIWEINLSSLHEVMNVNLMGTIYGLRFFIPIMLKQQEESHIVNTASGAGLHSHPNITGYTITKHSIVALSEVLYHDLKDRHVDHVHVSVLCPGSVRTQFAEKMKTGEHGNENKEMIALFKERLKHGMQPEEVVEKMFTSIQQNQFYILTHPEHKTLVQARFEDIFNERNPTKR